MKKGTYVIMTKGHVTGCGKEYDVNHIGVLCEDANNENGSFDVRFPIHSKYDSSWIPVNKFKEAPDQDKAKKLFEKGVGLCKKISYK